MRRLVLPVRLVRNLLQWIGLFTHVQSLRSTLQRVQMNIMPGVTVCPHRLVFIAGVPKAGTTWLENLIGSIPGFRRLAFYDPKNLLPEHILDPNLIEHLPVRGNFFIKTHVMALPEGTEALRRHGVPTIVMVRDLRDQCVSQFYHVLSDPTHPNHDFYKIADCSTAFSHCLDVSLNEYAEWIRGWLREIRGDSPFLLLRYEDLQADTNGQFARVLKHCDVVLTNGMIDAVIEKVSIEARQGSNLGIRLKQGNTFRAGRVGDWRSHFSSSDVERFKRMANDVLVSLGYERDDTWQTV